MGKYDLPATIDYILQKTAQKSIYYVGHSQGGTSLYTIMSLKPEYNEKVRLAVLLGPGGLMGRLPHPIYHAIAVFEKELEVNHHCRTLILQLFPLIGIIILVSVRRLTKPAFINIKRYNTFRYN